MYFFQYLRKFFGFDFDPSQESPPELNAYWFINSREKNAEIARFIDGLLNGDPWNQQHIQRDLDLNGLAIRSLPDAMHIRGTLRLQSCPLLERLGNNTRVEHDLVIGGLGPERSWKTIFPDRQKAEYLAEEKKECSLKELPQGLTVGRNLKLHFCNVLEVFPGDIRVGQNIVIRSARSLKEFHLMQCDGNLHLESLSRLKTLPEGMVINGDLDLIHVGLIDLPQRMEVRGDVRLTNLSNPIIDLSEWKIGGNIYLKSMTARELILPNTAFKGLKLTSCGNLEKLAAPNYLLDSLTISGCRAMRKLTGIWKVYKNCVLNKLKLLEALPEVFLVGETLRIWHCPKLTKFPESFAVGCNLDNPRLIALSWKKTPITEIPAGMYAKGILDVTLAEELKIVPNGIFSNDEVLFRGVRVPADFIYAPERVRPEDILAHPSTEVRRVALSHRGLEQTLQELKYRVVDEDTDAAGPRRLLHFSVTPTSGTKEELRFLQCSCPSTKRNYLLQVPPRVWTCRSAAAWMAGYEEAGKYKPVVET